MSLAAQMVKNLPAMQETILGQEDPEEKGMATHSSIIAWRTPWTEEPDRLQSMGSQASDTTEQLSQAQYIFVVIQLLSCVGLFVTLWTAAHQVPLSFTISWSLLKFMTTESVIQRTLKSLLQDHKYLFKVC